MDPVCALCGTSENPVAIVGGKHLCSPCVERIRFVADRTHEDDYRLYGGTPPHENVDTSADAARSVRPHVGKMQARVLAAIRIADPDGLICEQIERATGLSHQSASARVRELFLTEKVVKLGKRTGTSGRKQYVYGIAPEATQ